MEAATIIRIVAGIVVVICVLLIIHFVLDKVRKLTGIIYGINSLLEGMKTQEIEYANTPKNVSSGTGIYLPQIMRDFPEFHLEEMKQKAEEIIFAYLLSIHEQKEDLLDREDVTKELKNKLNMKIRALQSNNSFERYEQIKFHRTEIHRYRKERGRTSIVFQSAVGHIFYVEKKGKVVRGRKDRFTQNRYNVEMCYIQDREKATRNEDTGYSLHCPNCGAVITSLGNKQCPYCGSGVREYNIRVWYFNDVRPIKQ